MGCTIFATAKVKASKATLRAKHVHIHTCNSINQSINQSISQSVFICLRRLKSIKSNITGTQTQLLKLQNKSQNQLTHTHPHTHTHRDLRTDEGNEIIVMKSDRVVVYENDFNDISRRLVDMFVSLLSASWTDGDVVLVGLVHYVSILDTSWTAVVTGQSTCVQLSLSTVSTEVQ